MVFTCARFLSLTSDKSTQFLCYMFLFWCLNCCKGALVMFHCCAIRFSFLFILKAHYVESEGIYWQKLSIYSIIGLWNT